MIKFENVKILWLAQKNSKFVQTVCENSRLFETLLETSTFSFSNRNSKNGRNPQKKLARVTFIARNNRSTPPPEKVIPDQEKKRRKKHLASFASFKI